MVMSWEYHGIGRVWFESKGLCYSCLKVPYLFHRMVKVISHILRFNGKVWSNLPSIKPGSAGNSTKRLGNRTTEYGCFFGVLLDEQVVV